MSPDDNTLIALGLIAKPRGLRGEVFLRAYNEFNPSLRVDLPVIISTSDKSIQTTVESFRWYGKKLAVKFARIDSKEMAADLRGFEVSTQLKNLPPKEDGEFFVFDLVGLDIVDADGEVFGKIKDVLSNPANDSLIVTHEEREILVPLIREIIDEVDVEKGFVKVSRIKEFLL